MDRRLPAVVIAILALLLAASSIGGATAATEDGSGSTDTPSGGIDLSDRDYTAYGVCDTGDSAASWSYNGAVLSLGTGTVGSISMRSETSWGDWKLTSLTVDGEKVPEGSLSDYYPDDIFSSISLAVNGDVDPDPGVFKSIVIRSVTFGEGVTSIPANMFSGCTALSSVTVGDDVASIGANAFSGCTALRSIDIKKAAVDATAFSGCSSLAQISATGSTHYRVVEGLLLSDGGRTVHICPPGHVSGLIHLAGELSGVTRVNLNDADVVYVVDIKGRSAVTFTVMEGATASSITYSSLGMGSASVTKPAGGIRLTYTLYDSWDIVTGDMAVSGLTYSAGDGYFTLDVQEGTAATFLPMGVGTLTYGDLREMGFIGEWAATPDALPEGDDSAVVADIDPLAITVTGYLGTEESAVLDSVVHFHGLRCVVTKVDFAGSGVGTIQDLTLTGDMELVDGAFEYCAGLRSVTADGATVVGSRAFAYCTTLQTVSFMSCTEFGSRAFASCWVLTTVTVGAAEVSFGSGAFNGCGSIGVILADTDSDVSGNGDVPVVHYDMSDTEEKSFEVVGGLLVVHWDNKRDMLYSKDPDMQSGVTQVGFFKGDVAIVPISDGLYLSPSYGLNPHYLDYATVVFDVGLGDDPVVENVYLEGQGVPVVGYFAPSHFGYKFQYWELDGKAYDFSTPVTGSMVLKAVWVKADPVDSTPIYLLILLGASVVATFVVIAMTRRMNS